MAEEWRPILQREFDGEESSFIFRLHCGPGWDWNAFAELFYTMRDCGNIERWIANGFWFLSWRPRAQIEGDFPRNTGRYENALVNLEHRAWWLFTGDSRNDEPFEPMDEVPLKRKKTV